MTTRLPTLPLVTLSATVALLAGCGNDTESLIGAAADTVTVSAGDDACELEESELKAGSTTFAVTNEGSQVSEVYVYGEESGDFTRVVSEVENIGPGTSREMTVDLAAGRYEVACKPGQTGDGIRAAVTVTGDSGGDSHSDAAGEPAYDREMELSVASNTISGVVSDAAVGETIEFKLTNDTDGARTLELKDPSGTVAGEAEDIGPGETGELVVELDVAGTWEVVVEGDGVHDVVAQLPVT